jgi:hypothetical protein
MFYLPSDYDHSVKGLLTTAGANPWNDDKYLEADKAETAVMQDEKSAGWITIAIAAVAALTGVYTGLKGVKNQKLQGEYANAIAKMSFQDQQILNEKMLKAATQSERLAIMANAVASIKQVQAQQAEKNKNITTMLLITAGMMVLTAAYFIKKA